MKHLKNIKERQNNQDSEFDLRGLGGTSAIKAEYPLTHLSVQSIKDEVIKQCASIFSLEFKKSNAHKDLYHMFSPRHDLNHKEKSIILFAAALYISHVEHNVHMLLSEINQLAKLIKNENSERTEDQESAVTNWIKAPHHLSVHPGMQLYLSQAGFEITPKAEFQHFESESLTVLRKNSMNTKTQNVQRKKAAGE